MASNEDTEPNVCERLKPFLGEWATEAHFPAETLGVVTGRVVFEPALNGQFLLQHSEVGHEAAPDSLAVISVDPDADVFIQHYFDERNVVRTYSMTFADGDWTLLRLRPDFSPLDFAQRYVGSFSPDGDTIEGEWQESADGIGWKRDFRLVHRRVG